MDHLEFVCYGEQVVDNNITGYVPCGMKFPLNYILLLRNV